MSNIHGLGSSAQRNASNNNGGGPGGFGGFGMGGSSGSNGQPLSCTDKMKNVWNAIPMFNKFVLTTCSVIYLVSWISNAIVMYTILIPAFMMKFQVWRLITGPFCHNSIINLLFSVISYVPSGMIEEQQMGTVPMALRFFKLSLFINILYVVVALALGLGVGYQKIMMEPAMGLWPVIMCDIVIQCYQDPEAPRALCCCPFQVKSKWYPLILIAIFSIFFGPQFSLFAGLAVGYMYVFGYLGCLETSAPSIKKWEERFPFKSLKNSPSFRQSSTALQAPAGQSNRSQSQGSFGTSLVGGGNSSNTATQSRGGDAPARADEETKSNFKAFKGKGTSLGSESTTSFGSTRSQATSSGTSAAQLEADRQSRLAALQKQREDREKQNEIGENLETVELHEPETSDAASRRSNDAKGDYSSVNSNQYQL